MSARFLTILVSTNLQILLQNAYIDVNLGPTLFKNVFRDMTDGWYSYNDSKVVLLLIGIEVTRWLQLFVTVLYTRLV